MWRGLLLGLGLALIQGLLLAPLGQIGLGINLVLILVVLASLWLPVRSLLVLAFWGGFWLDVLAQEFFGLRTVFLIGLVGLIWLLQRAGLEFKRLLPVIALIFVGSLLYRLTLLGGIWWELESLVLPAGLVWFWLLEAGLNTAFALALRSGLRLVLVGSKAELRIKL